MTDLLGRALGRTNNINVGMPDPDGSSDPTSAAYSPAVVEFTTDIRPVTVTHTQPDRFPTQDQATTGQWSESFQGPSRYIDQTIGGRPGNGNTLGYSTGMRPRKESRTPLTGRVLVLKNMGVHPVVGEVGRDNRANKLFAGVASQNTDYQPLTTAQIAAQFTGRGIQLAGDE